MDIERFNSKDEAEAAAGENLNAVLMENKNRPVLLILSAGSAMSILGYIGLRTLGENITVSMLDERFSTDPAINNFLQFQKTDFYTEALDAHCSFFGTLPRHEDTMESLKQRWEKNLKTWRTENPSGVIIATLGMGPDGHTAGIFADSDLQKFNNLFSSDNWIAAYNVGDKHQYKDRLTTTLTFFKQINVAIGYVVGANKKDKLTEVIANKKTTAELPAVVWNEIKNVKVFTDIR